MIIKYMLNIIKYFENENINKCIVIYYKNTKMSKKRIKNKFKPGNHVKQMIVYEKFIYFNVCNFRGYCNYPFYVEGRPRYNELTKGKGFQVREVELFGRIRIILKEFFPPAAL